MRRFLVFSQPPNIKRIAAKKDRKLYDAGAFFSYIEITH
ncbi:hypothetical protein IGE_05252 [Bacillus cereus HuB1-1]|nr:hypothetical protein IGE_05252 [Bacillus cereus HuB1-1]